MTETSAGRVTVGDAELAYVRIGDGPTVVAIPGGPGFGHAHLRPGFDRLADGREIVYYDPRGSGDSELGDPERMNTAGMLADLDELVRRLEIAQAAFIGHSAAAWLAALFASTRPERVRALVLAHVGPPLVPELRDRFSAEMVARRPPDVVEEMERIESSEEYARRDPATIERHYRLRFVPFFRDGDNALSTAYGFTATTAAHVLDAGGRLFSDFGAHDPIGSLEKITCPTLVLHGELDPIPVESSQLVASKIPQARLVVLEGASHFAFLEDTDAFVGAVEPFLREHA